MQRSPANDAQSRTVGGDQAPHLVEAKKNHRAEPQSAVRDHLVMHDENARAILHVDLLHYSAGAGAQTQARHQGLGNYQVRLYARRAFR